MTKKLTSSQKKARVVPANGKSAEQRGARVQRVVKTVKAKARIDFVRSVRGR